MEASLPVRSERLLLRVIRERDFPHLFAILADADVMKLALYERALTRDEAQRFIEDAFAKDDRDLIHLGVLCRKEDDAVIGFAGLLPCKYFPDDLEFGFVLGRHHQQRGYAREIGQKLVDLALGPLGRVRVLALCDPSNGPSRNVLEKLGMSLIDEILTPHRGQHSVFEIRRADPATLPLKPPPPQTANDSRA